MKVVVGLGNPGTRYLKTRHNVGFMVLDALAENLRVKDKRSWRFQARIGKLHVSGHEVRLVKPQTHMNRSGAAVAPMVKRWGIDLSDLIIVVDDADLECGAIRIRPKGGAGGHNGLSSVISMVGSGDFVRVRVGIGPRPSGDNLVDFVLSKFSKSEQEKITPAVRRAGDAVLRILEDGLDKAMNEFNEKNA